MTDDLWLFDMFCCQGGAAKGYQDAGWRVVGMDIEPQPNYCGDEFIQAAIFARNDEGEWFATDEALEVLSRPEVVAKHASPPCQGETLLQYVNDNREAHSRLIVPTRRLLQADDRPYVIENVLGADLIDPVMLCGEMFGLGVIRHRLFETNWSLSQPEHIKHRGRVRGWRHGKFYDGPYVAVYGKGGGKASVEEASEAMEIDWMDADGLREAIPPKYTRYIGAQMLAYLSQKEAA